MSIRILTIGLLLVATGILYFAFTPPKGININEEVEEPTSERLTAVNRSRPSVSSDEPGLGSKFSGKRKTASERIESLKRSFPEATQSQKNQLQQALYREGNEFGKLGMGFAKEFILAAPDGVLGRSAIRGVVQGATAENASEFFEFIIENQEMIGERNSNHAILDLIDTWVDRDFNGAREFVTATSLGSDEQRTRWNDTLTFWSDELENRKVTEQDGARQPATAVDSKSKGSEKPKPEAEGRSR